MDTESSATSQTDESKAEQIQQELTSPPVPCLADTILQNHSSVIKLCQALATCKASSLSMLANMAQKVFEQLLNTSSILFELLFAVFIFGTGRSWYDRRRSVQHFGVTGPKGVPERAHAGAAVDIFVPSSAA